MAGVFSYSVVKRSFLFQVFSLVILFVLFFFFNFSPLASEPLQMVECPSAEKCFALAMKKLDKMERDPDKAFQGQVLLRRIQHQFPESDWGKRAGIRLGLLLSHTSPPEAVPLLRSALKDIPVLTDYVLFGLGEAYMNMGHPQQAARLFQSVLKEDPVAPLKIQTLFQAGQAWHEGDNCHAAIQLSRQALQMDPQFEEAPQALLTIGECALTLHKQAEAFAALREMWWRFPKEPEAKTGEQLLQQHQWGGSSGPTSLERFKRALSFSRLAMFEKAVAEFNRFLAQAPHSPKYREGQYRLALSLARLKRYKQAEKLFHQLSTSHSTWTGRATIWLARTYLREEKGPELLALEKNLQTRHLTGDQQALIHIFAGVWLKDQDHPLQAKQAFRRAAKIARSVSRQLDALWRMGWLSYQEGNFQQASSTFEKIRSFQEKSNGWAQATYWMARAMDHVKQNRRAQSLYREIARERPFTLYGQLAHTHLRQPEVDLASTTFLPPPSSEKGSMKLRHHVHYRKAVLLSDLHLYQEALYELNHLTTTFVSDKEVIMDLLRLAEKARAFQVGIQLAVRNFGEELQEAFLPELVPIWKAAYPGGYVPIIQEYARTGIDPYLVAGLIREESLYDGRATSPVGALGLMQLMPTTAKVVATRLGLPAPRREALFDTHLNIQLGTAYVTRLLRKFKGNLVYTVAAYNAGPKAVQHWIANNSHREPDEFMELIAYRETRQYVKRVLTSYRLYRMLFSPPCRAPSLDTSC